MRYRVLLLIGCLFVQIASAFGQETGLAPPDWPDGEFERFRLLQNTFDTERPLASGSRHIIAGTQSAFGVGAGLQVLRHGGNAMDAALTTAITQTVVQGGYGVSFAGWMAMLYYDAASGEVHALNSGYNTPLEEDSPRTIPHYTEGSGARAVLVPGAVRGYEAAHQRFGTLPWPALFESAIWFAREGIDVPQRLARTIQWKKDMIAARPEAAAILMPDGVLLQQGDRFRQTTLASTLERVASEGADYMYLGAWAERFVAALRAEGGKMTMEDLARYRPDWSQPWQVAFGGHRVLTLGAPNYGGYQLLEMLNLLQAAGVTEAGPYDRSASALAPFMRLSRAVGYLEQLPTHNFGAGYGASIGEYFPDIRTEPAARISPAHADAVWTAMQKDEWNAFVDGVMDKKREEILRFQRMLQNMDEPQRTDCVIVVDSSGNVATLLHTFNGLAWGYGLFVDGVSIPDSGSFQAELIAETGPGKRLPDPTHPVIVLDSKGRPILASNTAGSWIHGATSQFLFNALIQNMDPARAINTPQFWKPRYDDGQVSQQVGRGDFADDLIESLREAGVAVTVLDPEQHYGNSSYVIGVAINHDNGTLSGGRPKAFNGAVVAE